MSELDSKSLQVPALATTLVDASRLKNALTYPLGRHDRPFARCAGTPSDSTASGEGTALERSAFEARFA